MRLMSVFATVTGLISISAVVANAQEFLVRNLVTNDQSANPAIITDPLAQNVWGISNSPTGPFWVSDNGSGMSTVYRVNPTTDVPTPVVTAAIPPAIPGDGSVTGQVFNSNAGAFNGDSFLFVSEDGTVSGWRGALGANAETLVIGSSANVYKGSAYATISGHSYLYAANFRTGAIDVFKGDGAAPALGGSFTDPALPAGYAPFNIQNLNGKLYVTYAKPDAAKHDEIDGAGLGYVDAYDLNGNLLGRVGSQGALNAPWGLAIAPGAFGQYAGDLLVGNFGDGTIDAFNLGTDSYVGQLPGIDGNPLSIDGLWGLTPGNNGNAGSSSRIYFSAGPQGESNGLFGSLQAVPEPGVNLLLAAGVFTTGLLTVRRNKRRSVNTPRA